MNDRRPTRLFLDVDLGGDVAPLTDRETNYLGSVLRLKRGDRVLAFNGRGQERYAEIASLAKRRGELALREAGEPLPESPLALTLVQALPKTEAMDLIVQKITELGVHALHPVTSDFSVVRLSGERAERRIEHWRRIAQSACEQCGRHSPPDIAPLGSLDSALDALPAGGLGIVLDPRASVPLSDVASPEGSTGIHIAIGPEGGFSPQDLERLTRREFVRARFGTRVLRAETAAIAATALLQARWGDLR